MAFTYTYDDEIPNRQDHHFAFSNRGDLKSLLVQNEGGQLTVSIEIDAKKDGLKKKMEEMLQQGGVNGVKSVAAYGDSTTTYVSFETKDPKQVIAALAALGGNPAADVLPMIAREDLAKMAGTLVDKGGIDALQSGYMSINTVTLNGFERKGVDFDSPFMGITGIREASVLSSFANPDPIVSIYADSQQTNNALIKVLRDANFQVEAHQGNCGVVVASHPDKNPDLNNVTSVLARAGMLPDSVGKTVADNSPQAPQAGLSSFMSSPNTPAAPKAAAPVVIQQRPAAFKP